MSSLNSLLKACPGCMSLQLTYCDNKSAYNCAALVGGCGLQLLQFIAPL